MSKQVITASRLREGDVVYMAAGSKWVGELKDALAVESQDALDSMLANAAADVKAQLVLDPYTFPVDDSSGEISPLSMKERIRARGPSNRLDLGKQAANAA